MISSFATRSRASEPNRVAIPYLHFCDACVVIKIIRWSQVGPVFKKIEAISDEASRLRTFFVFVAEGIDGEEIATRGVCLDGKRNDQVAFHALADYQNHVIGWLQRE